MDETQSLSTAGSSRPHSVEPGAWPETPTPSLEALHQGSARFGRFTVLERIATGGMGVVYAAYDPELDRKVAIKLLREGAASETVRARIVREARAMAKLSHPNVAQVFEVGEYLGSTFIAMELVPGVTLRKWQQQQPRSWREVLEVYMQAGRGLAAAHAEGLVHRDFKPDNAMIGADGRVRVLDFGLVRADGHRSSEGEGFVERSEPTTESVPRADGLDLPLTKTGSMLGTPAYMSPEQFLGEVAGHQTDQFSLCISLWEALLGERPFEGRTREALIANVLAGRLRQPPRDAKLPPWVRAVLVRGLAVEPERRFPAMNDLLAALEADPSRRRRRVLAVGVGVTAVALAGTVYGLDRANRVRACEDEAASIADTWGDEPRERVKASLLATGRSYAQSTWERVEPRLDAYAATWAETRESTCLAAEVDGTRSEALARRTRECLDEHRDAFATLVSVLGDANEAVVRKAVTATAELPRLEDCTDDVRLAKSPQPPDDPEVLAAVSAARKEIAQVTGLSAFARLEDGRARMEEVVKQAEALGWAPLQAEALFGLGVVTAKAIDLETSERVYEQAFDLALREGHDEVAYRAAHRLIAVTGSQGSRPEHGRWWGELALTLAARVELVEGARTAATLDRLGSTYSDLGDHARAVTLFERAIAIRERIFGPVHPTYADALANLGEDHMRTGNYETARVLLERAVATTEVALGPDHPALVQQLRSLAHVHQEVGAYAEAKALAERAITIAEAAYGPEHYHVANQLMTLASAQSKLGDTARAKVTLERALEISLKTLGPEHSVTAGMIANLAVVNMDLGDQAKAKALYEQALAILEKQLGPDHADVGAVLINLANIRSERDDYVEASARLERAVAILEKALGPDHLRLAAARQNLGLVLSLMKRFEESKASYEAALAIYERTVGLAHLDAIPASIGVSWVDMQLGDLATARTRLERALPLAETLDPTGKLVARALGALAELELTERRFPEALALAERAVALEEAGQSPRKLAYARFLLAQAVLHVERDRPRALALAEQARDGYIEHGTAPDELAKIEAWLAAHRRGPAARRGTARARP